jgi:hypothetical protein
MMKLMRHGTKYASQTVFVLVSGAVVLASYILALRNLLTAEWVQVVTIFVPALAAATISYHATRAFTDGKAIESGKAPENGGSI